MDIFFWHLIYYTFQILLRLMLCILTSHLSALPSQELKNGFTELKELSSRRSPTGYMLLLLTGQSLHGAPPHPAFSSRHHSLS